MNGVTVTGLTKSFGEKTVFVGKSFFFPVGIHCITGRSGCGKTTFVRILAGLEQPDRGNVTGITGDVTFLFQEPRLFPSLTALRNVLLAGGKKPDQSRAAAILAALGLPAEDSGKKPSELSGGMKERTAIARAVFFSETHAGNTVILDEPFRGLDPETKRMTAAFVREAFRGKIVLVITHDREDAGILGGEITPFAP